jgi:glucose/arabinose dehydrogenase
VDHEEYLSPIVMWPEQAVPPGGIAFHGGDLFVSTMRSEALVRVVLDPVPNAPEAQIRALEHWFAESGSRGRYGRLRDVVSGPDGHLYVLTSNRDGRGRQHEGHDLILRLRIER